MGVSVDTLVQDIISGLDTDPYEYAALDRAANGSEPHLMLPYRPPEVWGCGITYERSRKAREGETVIKGAYDLVYEAERPEIFFKATGDRCVGPNEAIAVRGDSKSTVPESELAFVVGRGPSIIGYMVGNDVTARDIEGENPLYLPQAKIYAACCALGPAFVSAESIPNPRNLAVKCRILREGRTVFEGETSTSRLKRSLEELLSFLCRDNPIPVGSVCLTGTGIVPPVEFTLRDGDLVEIEIEGLGVLRNPVRQL
ncbi:MAG: fumarylacetoacetate hydrolase family protein [Candidatus Bathyarchaeia archaeon]